MDQNMDHVSRTKSIADMYCSLCFRILYSKIFNNILLFLRDWLCQLVMWLLEVYSISTLLFFMYFMEIKNWFSRQHFNRWSHFYPLMKAYSIYHLIVYTVTTSQRTDVNYFICNCIASIVFSTLRVSVDKVLAAATFRRLLPRQPGLLLEILGINGPHQRQYLVCLS